MSTNINTGLPDIDLLTQLANQLFKASPGDAGSSPVATQPVVTQGYSPLEYQGYLNDAGNLHNAPPDPHIANPVALPSLSGAGVSPGSAVQHLNEIDLKDTGSGIATTPFGGTEPAISNMAGYSLNTF